MTDAITAALSAEFDGPVLVHSDIRGLLARLDIDVRKAIGELGRNDDLMDRLVAQLQEIAGGRRLWIPAYNYDYCKTGLFDVRTTPSQVGALPEFFRTRKAEWRSDTPVFSTSGTGPRPDSISGDVVDPFGDQSEFHQLCQRRGALLFYGVPFSPTHTHYVERTATAIGPLYRYDKYFTGTIRYSDVDVRGVTLAYHVAPRGVSVRYDMPRLQTELLEAGIMRSLPPAFGRSYVVSAAELTAFWRARLHRDPFYLTTPTCRPELERLVEAKGGRLEMADFEDPSAAPPGTQLSRAIV